MLFFQFIVWKCDKFCQHVIDLDACYRRLIRAFGINVNRFFTHVPSIYTCIHIQTPHTYNYTRRHCESRTGAGACVDIAAAEFVCVCVCVFMYICMYNLKPMPFATNSTCIFVLYAPILISCTQGHCAKILEPVAATETYICICNRHKGISQLIGSSNKSMYVHMYLKYICT